MISLPQNISPSDKCLDQLKKYQEEVDAKPTFEERSTAAKAAFKSKNKKGNPTFKEIKSCLGKMCSGARRCVYCEDSVGDEVEHIFPKDYFPEKVFSWDNYVYACGNCNGPKNNKFAVFFQEAIHRLKDGQQPPSNNPVMINPRTEDPLHFAILDLKTTFQFVSLHTGGSIEQQRMDYTFNEILRLNHEDREFLRQAREEAYIDYKDRLFAYVTKKGQNASPHQLQRMKEQLLKKSHPTVWHEMKRYYRLNYLQSFDNELKILFDQAPEVLSW